MMGSCNEYGFYNKRLFTSEIGKREGIKALTQVLRQLLDGTG